MSQADRIARIRMELDDTDPTIWRSVQAAMPFQDYHLFEFEIGDKRYGIPDREWDDVRQTFDAKNIKLAVLVDRGVGRFAYTYDFGDNWQHTVTIETTIAADPAGDYPRFIDGARRAPPEDVGGIPGFEEFQDIMAKPRHRERKRLVEWYGGPFDSDEVDLPTITARIGKLAKRRALGKAAYAKAAKPQSLRVRHRAVTPNLD